MKKKVGSLAVKALLYEVVAYPKPGLVDIKDSGAHSDMDIFTFIDSSISLIEYFEDCFELGLTYDTDKYEKLMSEVRELGILAEKTMFKATRGINTHKGLVFSLGIICLAVGRYIRETSSLVFSHKSINILVTKITEGITKELTLININKKDKKELTYGESIYLKYGLKGIRGEVENGFMNVEKFGLPIFKDMIEAGFNMNDAILQTLINLMANVDDSNILGRHNIEMLSQIKEEAKRVLYLDGVKTERGYKEIELLNQKLIKNNVSPGGSADLVVVTIFYYLLENIDILN